MPLSRRGVLLSTLLAAGSLLFCVPGVSGLGVRKISEEEIPWKAILAALLANGPELLFRSDGAEGNAVVRGGWPVVVDYELEKPGFLILRIVPEKGEPAEFRIPEEGVAPAGSRRQDIRRLSAGLGEELQAGNLSVHAYEAENPERLVPFHLYGLGAGDRAVGSMTVADVRFSPAAIRVKRKEVAEYGFKALRSFSRAQAQISRLDKSGAPVPVWRSDFNPTPSRDEEPKGTWNGRDDRGRISKGLHTLQVNAWMSAYEGDWNAAAAATLVQVER